MEKEAAELAKLEQSQQQEEPTKKEKPKQPRKTLSEQVADREKIRKEAEEAKKKEAAKKKAKEQNKDQVESPKTGMSDEDLHMNRAKSQKLQEPQTKLAVAQFNPQILCSYIIKQILMENGELPAGPGSTVAKLGLSEKR